MPLSVFLLLKQAMKTQSYLRVISARATLLAGFLLSYALVIAQPYFAHRFTMNDGICGNEIRSIVQDNKGFLWLATDNGLCRFDGHRFHTLKGEVINSDEINCLYAEPNNPILWIGTPRDGLYRFNYMNDKWKTFRHHPDSLHSISDNSVTCLAPASDGRLWIATYWGGISKYDSRTGHFERFNKRIWPGLPSDQTWMVAEPGDGNLYIGHVYDGLSIVNLFNHTVRNFKYNDGSGFPSNNVYCLHRDNKGHIWTGTKDGLVLIDASTGRLKDYGKCLPLLADAIYGIEEINGKELWVTTESSQIVVISLAHDVWNPDSTSFSSFLLPQCADHKTIIRTLFKDTFGNVWVAGNGSGLNFYSHRRPLFHTTRNSGLADSLKSVHLNGNDWYIVDGCDLYVSGKNEKNMLLLHRSEIHDLALLGTDRIMVASNQGIDIIDSDNRQTVETLNCPVNWVWSVRSDDEGNIWAGTYGGGLYIYNSNHKLIHQFNTRTSFPSNIINDLTTDSRRRIWVATGKGVVGFTGEGSDAFIVYDASSGLQNEHILAITEDLQHNIWCSTKTGISCIRPNREVLNYSWNDGIPSDGFVHGRVKRSQEGKITFGTRYKMCSFFPEQLLNSTDTPRAFITHITLPATWTDSLTNEQRLAVHDTLGITLPYQKNTFTVNFSTADYALSAQTRYSYRLKGLTDIWTLDDGTYQATYHHIPPGQYLFELRAGTKGQTWSAATIALPVQITPPWWLTNWAKSLYLLTALILAGTLLYFWHQKTYLEGLIRSRKMEFDASNNVNRADNTNGLNPKDQEFVAQITRILEQHLSSEKLDVNFLASEMCMSPSNLYRRMKATTHLSSAEFIRKTRIRRAEQLMHSGKYTLTEIGEQVGYTTPETFRKAFKEEFGVTPSAYMKALRKPV